MHEARRGENPGHAAVCVCFSSSVFRSVARAHARHHHFGPADRPRARSTDSLGNPTEFCLWTMTTSLADSLPRSECIDRLTWCIWSLAEKMPCAAAATCSRVCMYSSHAVTIRYIPRRAGSGLGLVPTSACARTSLSVLRSVFRSCWNWSSSAAIVEQCQTSSSSSSSSGIYVQQVARTNALMLDVLVNSSSVGGGGMDDVESRSESETELYIYIL